MTEMLAKITIAMFHLAFTYIGALVVVLIPVVIAWMAWSMLKAVIHAFKVSNGIVNNVDNKLKGKEDKNTENGGSNVQHQTNQK